MNKSITQATQNDKQISNSIKKFFYEIPCFLSFESLKCLQKERRSCNGNLPVSVPSDLF